MDFTTTEAAQDLAGLVSTIVGTVCTPEHHRALDSLDERVDTALWATLIDAGILSSAAPESMGGDGFGILEQVAILTELGRSLAAVPYLESIALGASAIGHFGTADLRRIWGAPAIAGEKILTVALDAAIGDEPMRATQTEAGYRLTGTCTHVGYGPIADAYLVAAETDSGTAVFLVAADNSGVTMTSLNTTGLGSLGHLSLDCTDIAATRRVGGPDAVEWLRTVSTLGRAAQQLGVLDRGLRLTADYARTREQFDRPIGSFQAVSQRLADAFIDVKALRLTLTQAAWKVAEEIPADIDVATAAFWAADAGHRVAHTIVHVHGGVGIDTDYPAHRHFLAAKEIEFGLGGAPRQLRHIGRELTHCAT